MKGTSHLCIGIFAAYAVHQAVPLASSPLSLVAALGLAAAAALLPDIDSDEAEIRQITGTARSKGIVGRVVSWLTRLFGGHRALTHTLLAWLIVTFWAGLYFRGNGFAVAVSIGYLSHLIADMLTPQGVPLLWPVYRKRVRLLPAAFAIRTGSAIETLAVIAVGVMAIVRSWPPKF